MAQYSQRKTPGKASRELQSSSNSKAVGALSVSISDPPTQREVKFIMAKVNELINALRR